jgi:hypothetical protein
MDIFSCFCYVELVPKVPPHLSLTLCRERYWHIFAPQAPKRYFIIIFLRKAIQSTVMVWILSWKPYAKSMIQTNDVYSSVPRSRVRKLCCSITEINTIQFLQHKAFIWRNHTTWTIMWNISNMTNILGIFAQTWKRPCFCLIYNWGIYEILFPQGMGQLSNSLYNGNFKSDSGEGAPVLW